MKTTRTSARIAKLLIAARSSLRESEAYSFLPEIIRSLEAMQANVASPHEKRRRMASALERLVTEDFTFSESDLGGKLLECANEFASLEDQERHGE